MQYSLKQLITLMVVMMGVVFWSFRLRIVKAARTPAKKRKKLGRPSSTCNSCRGMWTLK